MAQANTKTPTEEEINEAQRLSEGKFVTNDKGEEEWITLHPEAMPTDVDGYYRKYKDIRDALVSANPAPVTEEYGVPMPEKSEYDHNEDWWSTYFPVVSKEDEEQRQRKAQQAQRWGLFTNALTAIGDAIGVSHYGGKAMQPMQLPNLDLQTWKNQLNADRARRASAENAQRQQYVQALNSWRTGYNQNKNYNTRALNEWQKQIDTTARNIFSAQYGMDKLAQVQANKEKTLQYQHNNRMDEIQKTTEGRALVKSIPGASSSGGRGGSGSSFNVDKLNIDEVNKLFDEAVEAGHIRKDRKNSKDVAAKRATLKKTFAKGGTSSSTSKQGGKSRTKIGW